jgi:hypothetical protein
MPTDLLQATRHELIERGRKFISLLGINHRFHRGVAYMKNDDEVVRWNCNCRIMVDPVTFRRLNPNYPYAHKWGHADHEDRVNASISRGRSDLVKREETHACASHEEHTGTQCHGFKKSLQPCTAVVSEASYEEVDSLVVPNERARFTEEELLISSPVVLGFDLSEKCWLEFSISGLQEIQWNENALHSVLIPDCTKQNLNALISHHLAAAVNHPASIADRKVKGVNVVLHGPPGVGKTMTGNAIAEHHQRPLYVMHTDDLGLNASSVAQGLSEAVENTRSWGAILLLDAADIYLEAREAHDNHHNSIVAVLLRFMERHHSLFLLTTDRVQSFDEAVQGHVHMGIRFESLSARTRMIMWRQQVVGTEQGILATGRDSEPAMPLSELDFDELSKRALDGRQVSCDG